MNKNKNSLIIFVVVFAIVIAGAWYFYNKFTKSSDLGYNLDETQQGQNQTDLVEAPDFIVYDGDGNEVKLSEKIGKPIVLNFWASWCPPCKAEMPDFEEVYKDMGEDIEFMMINATGGKETVESAKEHIEKEGYTFPVYFDEDADASQKYSATSIPLTVFIDKDGYIVAAGRGQLNKETLLQGIGMINGDDDTEAVADEESEIQAD